MEAFILFFVALAVITVVGHGLWLFAAMLIRGLTQQEPEFKKSALAEPRRDVIGMNRQIGQMLAAGAISQDIYESLRANLERYATRLDVKLPPRVGSSPAAMETPFASPSAAELSTFAEPSPFAAPLIPVAASGDIEEPLVAEIIPEDQETSESRAATTGKPLTPQPSRPTHALEREYTEKPISRPEPQRSRALADVLQSFLEEKNIRWGELVSGMLIVGSAVGLVISLRSELSRTIPYFPALLFLGITAAIHGAGMYTLHRWKLPSTSRGLLLIAMLLIPLNAAAACIFTEQNEATAEITQPLFVVAVAVGTIVWGFIAWQAGRALAPSRSGAWMLTVMSGSVIQPFINRLGVGEPSMITHLALFAVPIVLIVAATIWFGASVKRRMRSEERESLSWADAEQILMLLGLGLFSLGAAAVLAVFRADSAAMVIHRLAVPGSIIASILFAAGFLLRRRADKSLPPAFAIAGTSLALLGGMSMLAVLVLAWPDPQLLIATSLLNGAALLALAIATKLPWLDAGVVFNAAIASLTGVHFALGNLAQDGRNAIERYSESLIDGVSGLTLTMLALVVAVIGIGVCRHDGEPLSIAVRRRGTHASELLLSALVVAIAAVPIAVYCGFAEPRPDEVWIAVGILLTFGVAAIAAGMYGDSIELTGVGSVALMFLFALLLIPVNVVSQRLLPESVQVPWRWITALLAYGVVVGCVGAWLRTLRPNSPLESPFGDDPKPSTTSGLTHPANSLLIGACLTLLGALPVIIHEGFIQPQTAEVWLAAGMLTGYAIAAIAAGMALRQSFIAAFGGAMLFILICLALNPDNAISDRILDRDVEWRWRWLAAFLTHAAAVMTIGATLRRWRRPADKAFDAESPTDVLMGMGVIAAAIAIPLIAWIAPPDRLGVSQLSLHAGCAAVVAAVWLIAAWQWRNSALALAGQTVVAIAAALIGAAGLMQIESTLPSSVWQDWREALHVALGTASIAVACLAAWNTRPGDGASWLRRTWRGLDGEAACWMMVCLAGAVVIVSLGHSRDAWAVVTVVMLATVATILAAARNRNYLPIGAGLTCAAIIAGRIAYPGWLDIGRDEVLFNALAFASLGYGLGWLLFDIVKQRLHTAEPQESDSPSDSWPWTPAYIDVIGWIAVAYVLVATAGEVLMKLGNPASRIGDGQWLQIPSGWSLVGLLAVVLAVRAWERERRCSLVKMYLFGLSLVLLSATAFPWLTEEFVTVGFLASAGYLVCAGFVWRNRVSVALLVRRAGGQDLTRAFDVDGAPIAIVQTVLAFIISAFVVLLVFLLDRRDLRYLAAATPLLSGVALAAIADVPRRLANSPRILRDFSMVLLLLGIVCCGWADLDPSWQRDRVLAYAVRMLTSLSVATLLMGLLLPRIAFITENWRPTIKRATTGAAATAIVTLVAVLVLELSTFEPTRGVPLSYAQAAVVGAVLVALMFGLIAIALVPRHDPLSLSLQGRMGYIYAAETIFGLTLMHVYLSLPWLFQFEWRVYWPYFTMAAAFGGATVATMFERRGVAVLGQPLYRSFACLPLLPAIGMWLISSESDYDVVLFITGVFYMVLAATRGSISLALIAGAFGNAALLAFYGRFDGFAFVDHPQLWLIPPAVSTLAAIHWHRERLDQTTATFARYACVAVIYFSSTSEILITGIGRQLWPPMILALLSVGGVLAGMLLHIRSFLYFGIGFLFMSLLAMVSHAQQAIDHTWPWWAFGITLGIAVLVFFGVFEKKRAEIEGLIRHLRQWQG